MHYLRIFIHLFLMMIWSLNLIAQNNTILEKRIDLRVSDISFKEVLNKISKETGIGFTYSDEIVSLPKKVTIDVKNQPLKNILDQILSGTSVIYQVIGNQIVFQRKKPVKKRTLSGYISDKESGERIIGVIVQEETTKSYTVSNNYGFYSITLPEGDVKINFSCLGYDWQTNEFNLSNDTVADFQLVPSTITMNEITVTDKANRRRLESTQMGINELQMKNIKSIPSLIGERDVLKTLQLLPGIQQGAEGSSALYVRGGSSDQNLILLDGAPVYNTNHLFGYVSTFNDDAIQNVTVLKGGIPARYGGRLSSVVDIRMKEGNNKKIEAQMSIGTLASRFTIEGPIFNEKTSFVFSARRTYFDLLTRPLMALLTKLSSTDTHHEDYDIYYYFQDYNMKLNHGFSSRSRLFFSLYAGRDVLSGNQSVEDKIKMRENSEKHKFSWGNYTTTARWNYIFSDKLFSNVTFIFSQYQMNATVKNSFKDSTLLTETDNGKYSSGIHDYGDKIDLDYYFNTNHTLHFGIQNTLHIFSPGHLNSSASIENVSNSTVDTSINLRNIKLAENEIYVEDEIRIDERLKTNLGLRYSFASVESKTFHAVQPRINLRYLISENWSAKASWCVMNQNLSLLTSQSSIGYPSDLWIPATKTLKPQSSSIYSLGTLYVLNNNIEISSEIYYKTMHNVMDYKDGTSYIFADMDWDKKISQGKGVSYGAEFLIEKKTGNTTGWLGYSLAKSKRQFRDIDNGEWFPYQYDRRHNINLVIAHHFSENFEIGAAWVVSSGALLTAFNQKYPSYFGSEGPVMSFDSRNNLQAPLYHRLDVNVSFTKQKKWGIRTWTIGCYNAYNRKNPTIIYASDNRTHQLATMPILPSITYTLKFKKKQIKKEEGKILYDIPDDTTKLSPKVISRDSMLSKTESNNDINLSEGATVKGHRLVGLSLSAFYTSQPYKMGYVNTNFSIAKFRTNHFVLGSQFYFGFAREKFKDESTNKIEYGNKYSLSYGILNRYFIGKSNTKPFVQIIPRIIFVSGNDLSFGLGFEAPLSVGVAHFISNHVAVEAALTDNILQFNDIHNLFKFNGIDLNFAIGLQVYFP